MKNELFTSIFAAVAGVLIAYFVTNLFIGEIKDTTVKTVEGSISTDLAEPNPEVFNYKALNPTVEVYVGNCTQYSDNGECLDQVTNQEITNLENSGSTQADQGGQ